MLKKEPSPERARLGFKEAVLNSFEFLKDEDFHAVEQEITLVRYESDSVFINIFHGRSSFEMGVEIGRLNEPDKKLSLHDIIAAADSDKAEGAGCHGTFAVSSRKGVKELVPKLADLVIKYAMPFLHGDDAEFTSAFKLQSERWKAYVKEVNLRNIRKRAEAVWQEKDYDQVVELLDSIRGDLTEVEAKKLAYAEQHVVTTKGTGS